MYFSEQEDIRYKFYCRSRQISIGRTLKLAFPSQKKTLERKNISTQLNNKSQTEIPLEVIENSPSTISELSVESSIEAKHKKTIIGEQTQHDEKPVKLKNSKKK